MPYLTETVSWVAELGRQAGLGVRRIVDIGSGPGVAACVLAREFDTADVLAVDASREMLESAADRAEALGLSGRVRTLLADLPDDLAQLGGADLVWIAMVLHHFSDQVAVLRGLRSVLQPGGMLAIVEFGDAPRFLPEDVGTGHPGLLQRLGNVNPAEAFPPVDSRTVEAGGFEIVAERMARVSLAPPLSKEARAVARGYLQWMSDRAPEGLDAQDRQTLDLLMDESSPLGIMRREDAFLEVSRKIYVARAV